jgi:ribonuclease HII
LSSRKSKPYHRMVGYMPLDIMTMRKYGNDVCGVDEVGTGSMASSVYACALVVNENAIPNDFKDVWINDSKMLDRRLINKAFRLIKTFSTYALGTVGIDKINEVKNINIIGDMARKIAVLKLIKKLGKKPDAIICDYFKLDMGIPCVSRPRADSNSFLVACASIVAKYHRDKLMMKMAKKYPGYGFETNVGYRSEEHLLAIRKMGILPIHRKYLVDKWLGLHSNLKSGPGWKLVNE